jgi:dihydrofolate reductase
MIRLIAAIDRQRGIAKKGYQPWLLPTDEAYFAEQTKSHGGEILVGRTTYETFGGPLPDRINHVLTHRDEPLAGAFQVHDLEEFLTRYADKDVWVIGGANVYKQVMDLDFADELYITAIDADFGCDQFFPLYDNYRLVSQSKEFEENGFRLSYRIYVK